MSIQTNSPSTNLGTSVSADGIAQLLGYDDAADMNAAIAAGGGGNPKAILYKTADQSGFSTSGTLITWDASELDTGFALSSNELTLSDVGVYKVTTGLATSGTTGGAICVYLVEDWTSGSRVEVFRFRDFATSSTNQYPGGSGVTSFAAGTKLRFYMLMSTGSANLDADGSVSGPTKNCFAIIEKIG